MKKKKYKNKYRIDSHRMKGWDYSANGFYFITICVQNMRCIFGHIINGEMILSEFGKIADDEWHKSFEMRQELILHQFILMPNHLHAIIEICGIAHSRDARPCVSAVRNPANSGIAIRKPKSISSFIAGYKSATINKIDDYIDEITPINGHPPFRKYNRKNPLWQANYHDHIIRDYRAYYNISNYIINNPRKWSEDKFYGKK